MSEPDKVVEQLYAWLTTATELRFGSDINGNKLIVPAYEEGPETFARVLLQARQRADRIEELLSKAKRVRRRLAVAQQEAADVASDKRDIALADGATKRVEYSIGDERRAEANLASFTEKRAERAAQRRLDAADEVVDALKDMHFGLGGFRTDVRDVIRSYQLISNLET